MEFLDVVNEDDEVVGKDSRESIHSSGKIHRTVFFFIFDENYRIFVNRRTMNKDFYPGYWSILLGGHVKSGESYEEAVKKECMEETNISSKPFFISDYKKRYDETDRENVKIYGFFKDMNFFPSPEEIDEGEFLALDELKVALKERNFLPETNDMLIILMDFLKKKNQTE